MFKPLAGLVVGSLLALAAAAAYAADSRPPAFGLALTLPPALLTLVLVALVSERWPLASPAAAVGAAGFRMVVALLGVSLLGGAVEKLGIPRQSLAEWTCGFYLVTLALETGLLWGRLARVGRPEGPPA